MMTTRDRKLLRPEDAASLEEFEARRVVEQAQIRALNSSWKDIGRIVLSGFICFVAIFFWVGVATSHDGTRWFFLVLAIIVTLWFLRMFGRIELRGVRGSKRYLQLDRLSKQWQARAARGEIPQTMAGGPKVWRDELDEANTQGT
jgi:hypothetical protein